MNPRLPRPFAAVVVLMCCISIGCQGWVSETDLTDPSNPDNPTQKQPNKDKNKDTNNAPDDPDDPEAPLVLTHPHLRRLTPKQYKNTVVAALGDIFEDDDFPQFDDDIPTIGLSNNPQKLRINDVNINSIYQSTQQLARRSLTATPMVADCVSAQGDACFGEIVDTLGLKLWRRPVTTEERDDLLGARAKVATASGTRAQQAEFLLSALMMSPNMLYRTELGQPQNEVRQLDSYELAQALSYALWNEPPDQTLMDLAKSDQLQDREVLKAQARRLAQDPKLAQALAAFFIDYLKIEALFSKEKIEDLGFTNQARRALFDGIRQDLIQQFLQPGATLLDPFSSNAFHINDQSASFFGVPVTSSQLEVTTMPPTERHGILSHPAFLAVHSNKGDSGIVKRGVFTLEQLMCVHLGTPPDDIAPVDTPPEGFDASKVTSREALSVLHSSQPTCVGCHQIIDPAGYGFENFDAAGRYRTTEKENIAIDASGTLAVNGEQLNFTDSTTFVKALAGSESLKSCVAESFLTYMLGDKPGAVEKKAFYEQFKNNQGSIDTLIDALIDTPSFTQRRTMMLGEAP